MQHAADRIARTVRMRGLCIAECDGRQAELPTTEACQATPERVIVTIFTDGERILLERRPEAGIWGGLLAPPEGTPEAFAPGLGLSPGVKGSAARTEAHLHPTSG
ncbi:MAG: hypothetical protein IPL58_10970 [Betaproteobacteria bacterium]|uniref:Nudix hydrolase domain-containing protein n=1 Tax=Candidatus Proximibacter danicus TaxID=2954365 RepID=A0A9D7K4L5_9PROT|nr:hypothetical protein [Candidatus Proximibacter danicus]